MKLYRWIPILLMVSITSAFSQLSAPPGLARADRCMGSKTEAELTACRRQELAESEKSIKDAVAKLKESLKLKNGQSDKLLVAIQKTWPPYRDASCRMLLRDQQKTSAYKAYFMDCQKQLNSQHLSLLMQLTKPN